MSNADAEYPNLSPLLHDFGRRLAQEKPDSAQLAIVKGYEVKLSEAAAKLSEPKRKPNLPCLTAEELEACRKGRDWELEHGIIDRVVCRLCGAMPKHPLDGKKGHLRVWHGMSSREYRAAYPGARLRSFKRSAMERGCDVQEVIAIARSQLKSEDLEACRKDPDWERRHGISDYVICRECGVMLKEHLGTKKGHLWRQHSMSVQDYHAAYPNAPLQTCKRLAKYRGRDVQELMATPFSPPRGHRAWLQRITSQELEACRLDPAWEARQGISDRQVCRICGAIVKTALGDKKGHLWMRHRISVANYRLAFPGARVRAFKAELDPEGKTRGGGYDVQQFMATFSSKFLVSEELEACRNDPEWERHHNLTDVVVCRECGKKLSNIPGSHLRLHDLTRKEYLIKYSLAPMRAAKFTAASTAYSNARRAELKKFKQAAKPNPVGRPSATPTKLTKKQELFIAAARLYDRLTSSNPHASWGMVAQQLAAHGYDVKKKADGNVGNGEADRLRVGANDVREKFPQFFSV